MTATRPGTTPDTLTIPDEALAGLFDAIHQDLDTATETLRHAVAKIVAAELRRLADAQTWQAQQWERRARQTESGTIAYTLNWELVERYRHAARPLNDRADEIDGGA